MLSNAIVHIFVKFVIVRTQLRLAEYKLRRHFGVGEEPRRLLRSATALAIAGRCGMACTLTTSSGRAVVLRIAVAAVVVDGVGIGVAAY